MGPVRQHPLFFALEIQASRLFPITLPSLELFWNKYCIIELHIHISLIQMERNSICITQKFRTSQDNLSTESKIHGRKKRPPEKRRDP